MGDRATGGRRSPAWVWYGVAAAALAVLALLDVVGVLGSLGP